MVLAYLLSVLAAVVVLAVALRRRPAAPVAPIPPTPAAAASAGLAPELRLILTAAHQLAARLDTAA